MKGQQFLCARLKSLYKLCIEHYFEEARNSVRMQTSLASTKPSSSKNMPLSIKVSTLLEEYQDLFELLAGLLPIRDQDHATTLIESTSLVFVRPYRYPYVQKNEIERLVKEMLVAGIIQPSTSPFSSLVILAKKK